MAGDYNADAKQAPAAGVGVPRRPVHVAPRAPDNVIGWMRRGKALVWDFLKRVAGLDADDTATHKLFVTAADADADAGSEELNGKRVPQSLAEAYRSQSLEQGIWCLAKQPAVFADVTFVVGRHATRVPAHRALFAARSAVFERLLFPPGASPPATVTVCRALCRAFASGPPVFLL